MTQDGSPASPSAPNIASMNCTSCNIPFGDTTEPYTTSDTTPTFTFNTSVAANCSIADENWNYTTMGASRNCSSGDETLVHTCTLGVQDELIYKIDYVYISCANAVNNNQTWNATTMLLMDITGLEANTSNAIDNGIQHSSIWPGATVYNDQQVYLRSLNNNQLLTTVDRVAVFGNQRWILNYENTTTIGLFNISPAVYVIDLVNLSLSDIETHVANLINSTKT
ncbi:hypothetical protein HY772_01305 [Candidatus Woesearchaeota archaeon]|nr:hypothetical protein [Candidatus Woesearchaeota archaeon]